MSPQVDSSDDEEGLGTKRDATLEDTMDRICKKVLSPYLKELTSLTNTVATLSKTVEQMATRLNVDHSKQFATALNAITERFTDTVEYLDRKITDNEDRDRRVNIIVLGLKVEPKAVETEVIRHIETLGVQLNPRSIERSHHLRKDGTGPIVVKFHHDKTTQEVMRAARDNNKGHVKIKGDFSARTRIARGSLFGKLIQLKKEARANGRPEPWLKIGQIVDGRDTYNWHHGREKIEHRKADGSVTFLDPVEPPPEDIDDGKRHHTKSRVFKGQGNKRGFSGSPPSPSAITTPKKTRPENDLQPTSNDMWMLQLANGKKTEVPAPAQQPTPRQTPVNK